MSLSVSVNSSRRGLMKTVWIFEKGENTMNKIRKIVLGLSIFAMVIAGCAPKSNSDVKEPLAGLAATFHRVEHPGDECARASDPLLDGLDCYSQSFSH